MQAYSDLYLGEQNHDHAGESRCVKLCDDAVNFKGACRKLACMAQMLLLPSLLNIECLLVALVFVISFKIFF